MGLAQVKKGRGATRDHGPFDLDAHLESFGWAPRQPRDLEPDLEPDLDPDPGDTEMDAGPGEPRLLEGGFDA